MGWFPIWRRASWTWPATVLGKEVPLKSRHRPRPGNCASRELSLCSCRTQGHVFLLYSLPVDVTVARNFCHQLVHRESVLFIVVVGLAADYFVSQDKMITSCQHGESSCQRIMSELSLLNFSGIGVVTVIFSSAEFFSSCLSLVFSE